MESIDRMREWWRDGFPVMDRRLGKEFRWYLDNIEREVKELADERDLLKRQLEAGVDFDQRLEACADRREDVTLWGVDYTALPVDADGVPIHVGDVLDPPADCDDYAPMQVVRLMYDGYEQEWFFDGDVGGFCGMVGERMDVAGWTHHHAPTVEDVLREFADKWLDTDRETNRERAVIAEYAARLRLAGDE